MRCRIRTFFADVQICTQFPPSREFCYLGGAEPLTVSLVISLKPQTDTKITDNENTLRDCHPHCLLYCAFYFVPPVQTKANHKRCLFDEGVVETICSCSLTHLQLIDGFHKRPVRAVATVGLIQQAVQHLPDCLPLIHHHGLGALV